jgi:uncharacterized protein (DUF362 family)
MKKRQSLSRRDFIRWLGMAGAGVALGACGQPELASPRMTRSTQASALLNPVENAATKNTPPGIPHLVVSHGENPAEITRRAMEALGGMGRFVRNGNDVIIKPNICTDYHSYEYAATTNPEVVAELVQECLAAGARRVRVMDFPFGGTAQSAYRKSGIADAVEKAGGEMEVMVAGKFAKVPIPLGVSIKDWSVYQDVLATDVLIDVPIAKHHGSAGLTLGGKNLMGVIQARSMMHSSLHQRIADITSLIRPDLTVIDAYRILTRHGPTGGNLDDVKLTKMVIASADIVAADAYACTLFGKTADDIGYVRMAAEMGIGTKDLTSIKTEELTI